MSAGLIGTWLSLACLAGRWSTVQPRLWRACISSGCHPGPCETSCWDTETCHRHLGLWVRGNWVASMNPTVFYDFPVGSNPLKKSFVLFFFFKKIKAQCHSSKTKEIDPLFTVIISYVLVLKKHTPISLQHNSVCQIYKVEIWVHIFDDLFLTLLVS